VAIDHVSVGNYKRIFLSSSCILTFFLSLSNFSITHRHPFNHVQHVLFVPKPNNGHPFQDAGRPPATSPSRTPNFGQYGQCLLIQFTSRISLRPWYVLQLTRDGQKVDYLLPATSLGVEHQPENGPSSITHTICTTYYDDDEEMTSNYGGDNESYERSGNIDDDAHSVISEHAMSICPPTEYAESDREGESAASEHALSEYDGDDDGGPQLQESEHDEADSPLIRPIRCAFRIPIVTTLKSLFLDTIDTVPILRGILLTQAMGRSSALHLPVRDFESTADPIDISETWTNLTVLTGSRMGHRSLLRQCTAHSPYNTGEIGVDPLESEVTRSQLKLNRVHVSKRSSRHRKMKTGQ
jgi:hypothetical protein